MTADALLRDQAVAALRLTTRGLKNYTPTPTSYWQKALDLLAQITALPSNVALRDAAVAELKQTTRGLSGYTPTPTSHWGKALGLLARIDVAPPPPARRNLGAIRICSACAATSGDLSWAGWVIYQEWEAARVAALKANGAKVLAYRNASLASPSGGLTKAAMQPEWFALIGGVPAVSTYYSDAWFADVGHAGYQQAWADDVISRMQAGGWSGAILDDVNQHQGWHLAGRVFDKYPTTAAWSAAMESFLTYVGGRLKAANLLVIPNVFVADYWNEATKLLWLRWAALCSGMHKENWMMWSTPGSYWGEPDFGHWLDIMKRTQAAGRSFLTSFYAAMDNDRAQAYARAAFLLAYDPSLDSALTFLPQPEAQPPWSATWTKDLGAPLGPFSVSGGVYTRLFSGGKVTLDTNTKTAVMA